MTALSCTELKLIGVRTAQGIALVAGASVVGAVAIFGVEAHAVRVRIDRASSAVCFLNITQLLRQRGVGLLCLPQGLAFSLLPATEHPLHNGNQKAGESGPHLERRYGCLAQSDQELDRAAGERRNHLALVLRPEVQQFGLDVLDAGGGGKI